jgi:hypothetical protein
MTARRPSDRNVEIVARVMAGEMQKSIAGSLGLSHQRISQIVRRDSDWQIWTPELQALEFADSRLKVETGTNQEPQRASPDFRSLGHNILTIRTRRERRGVNK